MNRRGFLQALTCAPAVVALPTLASHPRPWEIDGARIVGRSFIVHGPMNIGRNVVIEGCQFRVSLRGGERLVFGGSGRILNSGFDIDWLPA